MQLQLSFSQQPENVIQFGSNLRLKSHISDYPVGAGGLHLQQVLLSRLQELRARHFYHPA